MIDMSAFLAFARQIYFCSIEIVLIRRQDKLLSLPENNQKKNKIAKALKIRSVIIEQYLYMGIVFLTDICLKCAK